MAASIYSIWKSAVGFGQCLLDPAGLPDGYLILRMGRERECQIFGLDVIARGEECQPFHQVAQFTHVARQGCPSRRRRAEGENLAACGGLLTESIRKYSASKIMSSPRSRNEGRSMVTTFSRK